MFLLQQPLQDIFSLTQTRACYVIPIKLNKVRSKGAAPLIVKDFKKAHTQHNGALLMRYTNTFHFVRAMKAVSLRKYEKALEVRFLFQLIE